MAWALRFAGGTEVANFSTINRTDSAWRIEFRIANKSLSSNLTNRIMINQSTFNDYVEARWRNSGDYINYRIDAVSHVFTHALNITGDNDFHNYIIECDGTNLSTSIDGNSLGSIVAAPFFKDFGKFNGTQDLEYFRYYNLDGGETLIYDWDATASSHAAGAVILDELVSGNDATGVGMPTDGSAWIDLGGGITVTSTLGAINYNSQSATISLTGSIDVNTTLGAISYSSQSASISLAGDVDITATLGSINYTSQNATVSVTGDIDVTSTLGTIAYSSNDTTVNLTSDINVSTTLGAINYSSNSTAVTLSGLIGVNSTLGSIVYNSYPVMIRLGEGQDVGNVTAGFADDIYTAGFKPDTITVSFK